MFKYLYDESTQYVYPDPNTRVTMLDFITNYFHNNVNPLIMIPNLIIKGTSPTPERRRINDHILGLRTRSNVR